MGKNAERATAMDHTLVRFDDLPERDWSTLVLGNGYSINLWRRFQYDTLRDEAALEREADDLFDELDTTNFEGRYPAHQPPPRAGLVTCGLSGPIPARAGEPPGQG